MHYVVIGDGTNAATLNGGNAPAISMGNYINITVEDKATVRNNASNGQGKYPGAGANTIEVRSNSVILVKRGGSVISGGAQTNAEAINVMGFGNVITIEEGGLVQGTHGAAIWFQDTYDINMGYAKNTVYNSGTIQGKDSTSPVFGSQGPQGASGIVFDNKKTGKVIGSLKFGSGNDELKFEAGLYSSSPNAEASVTGYIDGGGGTNSLTLYGDQGESSWGVLAGDLKNFQTLDKDGTSTWVLEGSMTGFEKVNVNEGTLYLKGDNRNFNGTATVFEGTLVAEARSLPTNAAGTDNVILSGDDAGDAKLIIRQDYDGAYTGQIVTASGKKGQVIKDGSGTVTLNPTAGENTYEGVTVIRQGGLAISTQDALGLGGVTIAGGSLVANADLTLDGVRGKVYVGNPDHSTGTINTQGYTVTVDEGFGTGVDGGNIFQKQGGGTLVLNAENLFAGTNYVQSGTLVVNDKGDDNLPGEMYVLNGARLAGVGALADSGVYNSGTVAAGPGDASGTLTIRGDYQGQPGGTVEVHAVMGGDDSAHNFLLIEGDASIVPSSVRVVNHGGLGAETDRGIPAVGVIGNYDSQSQFRLAYDYRLGDGTEAVIVNDTSYGLFFDDTAGPEEGADNVWYLRNLRNTHEPNLVIPSVPLYEIYPLLLGALNRLPTLEQRVGHRNWLNELRSEVVNRAYSPDNGHRRIDTRGVWIRLGGTKAKYLPRLDSGGETTFDLENRRLSLGADIPVWKSADDGSLLMGGLNVNFGRAESDIESQWGQGWIKTKSEGFGASLTWYDQSGFYADGQFRYNFFNSDIHSRTIVSCANQVDDNEGQGYAASLELGRIIDLNNIWSLTPQAQLSYSRSRFDSYVDPQDNRVVDMEHYESLEGRLGLAVNYENSYLDSDGEVRRSKLYLLGNLYHEFKGEAAVGVGTTKYKSELTDTWVGAGLGGSHNWGGDQFSVYGEIGARSSTRDFGDDYELNGELGFRIMF